MFIFNSAIAVIFRANYDHEFATIISYITSDMILILKIDQKKDINILLNTMKENKERKTT